VIIILVFQQILAEHFYTSQMTIVLKQDSKAAHWHC